LNENECLRAGDEAPREHDAGDPLARAEPVQRQIARHFEEEVGDKEDAGRAAECGCRQTQVLAHAGAGETDIDPVQVGDKVAKHQEWHQAPGHFGHGALLER
jgi:hypothetical protein